MEARPNIVNITKTYITTIFEEVPGIKALILDAETINIVSLIYPKSLMLSHEVFYIETIANLPESSMPYMKAIFLLRATEENKAYLVKQLKSPIFSEYYIYFTNIPVGLNSQSMLQELASNDEKSIVKTVQEFYADFCVLNKELFTLNLSGIILLQKPRDRWASRESSLFNRMLEGLMSVLLSTRKNPIIRYQRSSEVCNRLARELSVLYKVSYRIK